jgi:hypothetical protein
MRIVVVDPWSSISFSLVTVMQQLILLLTSFLLGCGFPAFLIGFYSVRIWVSRFRSYSLSFAGSDSSGSGHDKAKSKHKKSRRDRSKDRRKETGGDRPGREKLHSPTFSSSKRVVTRSILGPHLLRWMCCPLADRPLVCLWREFYPPLLLMLSPHWSKGGLILQHRSLTASDPFAHSRLCCFVWLARVWRCWEGSLSLKFSNSLGTYRNRSLDPFLLPLPACRKLVVVAPLSRRVALPILVILLVYCGTPCILHAFLFCKFSLSVDCFSFMTHVCLPRSFEVFNWNGDDKNTAGIFQSIHYYLMKC